MGELRGVNMLFLKIYLLFSITTFVLVILRCALYKEAGLFRYPTRCHPNKKGFGLREITFLYTTLLKSLIPFYNILFFVAALYGDAHKDGDNKR